MNPKDGGRCERDDGLKDAEERTVTLARSE
jgi:hypothetical protein